MMTNISTTSPKLVATPVRAFSTDLIELRASGFAAGERVRLESRLTDDVGLTWRANGEYIADHRGEIEVSNAPSEGGTFSGTDPAGLFWSLSPEEVDLRTFQIAAEHKAHQLGLPACDPLRAFEVSLLAIGQSTEARATVVFDRIHPDVEAVPVRDGRLRGTCFRWRDRSQPRGAIMSLTGSGGGVDMNYAPALASLGYDVFSLAYFAYEDLPATISRIPLEYFAEGFDWMCRELGAERIAVQGGSRGGELTLLLASHFPRFVQGAIAIVPMFASMSGWDPDEDSTDPGPSWTLDGQAVPFAPPLDFPSFEEVRRIGSELSTGMPLTPIYMRSLENDEARNAAIPVEQMAGPLLLISGVGDAMWPSAWGADLVFNRLRAKGFAYPFKHLALEGTGHWTPLPNAVTTFTPALYHTLISAFLACGGDPQQSARNSWIMWDAIKAHYRSVFD